MLRKVLCAVASITLLTGVAYAQLPMPGISLGGDRQMTPEEKEKQRLIENDYKRAMDKIPDKKAVDPWGGVRQGPSAASKPKQGQQ
jgi:hypothetical protein